MYGTRDFEDARGRENLTRETRAKGGDRVAEPSEFYEIVVYPNPATSDLIIAIPDEFEQNIEIEFYSVFGIKAQSFVLHNGMNRITLSIQSGIYSYRVVCNGEVLLTGKQVILK